MRASAGRELHLLFPMVTTTAEFLQAKKLVEFEKKILSERQSALPSRILYGAMLEVPAIVWMLDDLLPQVDFVSVGSNDLAQFFFAVDRASPLLSGRYDRLSVPFLNLLQYIVEKANQFQKPLSLCGEMASHPLEAAVLLALGFRQLSMPASAIGPIKMMIHHLHLAHLKTYIDYLCARNEQRLRQKLHFFAYDHGFIKEQIK
jgi:phosphotransferase system enzyme I (PtsP)